MKENNGVDISKLIMSFLVVAIHYSPLRDISMQWDYLLFEGGVCRIAVPFFFISSAYYFFKGTRNVKDYCYRIIKLYLGWSVIYLPFIAMEYMGRNDVWEFIRDYVFSGIPRHIWYLKSLIVAILIVYLLRKCINRNYIMVIGIFLYMFGLMWQSYYYYWERLIGATSIWKCLEVARRVILTSRNGIFFGIVFVASGLLIVDLENYVHLKKRSIFLGMIICVMGLEIETFWVGLKGYPIACDMFIALVPTTFFFFLLVKDCEIDCFNISGKKIRKLSSLIYFLHIMVGDFFCELIDKLGLRLNSLGQYLVILITTMGIAVVIMILDEACKTRLKKFV